MGNTNMISEKRAQFGLASKGSTDEKNFILIQKYVTKVLKIWFMILEDNVASH